MRKCLLLTLASNGKKVAVVCDNITLVVDMEEESKVFTRIFLKYNIDEETKWVDVMETSEQIAKMMR